MAASAPRAGEIDGDAVARALRAATAHLRSRAHDIDAINVYPVPDGDTGSNMLATMEEAVAGLPQGAAAGAVLAALARGALYGARGNSGVILSQALGGMARAATGLLTLDAPVLTRVLVSGAEAAYRAVASPQEGTMLTVLRGAAEAASATQSPDALAVFRVAVAAAEAAEESTMAQLPALAEAGVTDAGGEGVCVLLRGLLAALSGEPLVESLLAPPPIAMQAGHEVADFGFCTEFLIEPEAGELLDLARLRAILSRPGASSLLLVGDERLARVHVHVPDPAPVFAAAAQLGRLSRTKAEDMSAQHRRYARSGSGAGVRTALLALSRGDGFDRLFESLGAAVHDLGEITRPAAGEVAAAADALGVADVIVLPNHRNVILAAGQARSLTRCALTCVGTRSLPEGIAAALAFDPARSAADNLAGMERVRTRVRTVEVTVATTDRRAEGLTVMAGDAIALVDDILVHAGPDGGAALVEGLRRAGGSECTLITVYAGAGLSDDEVSHTSDGVARAFPGAELEWVDGGQSLYRFVASVET